MSTSITSDECGELLDMLVHVILNYADLEELSKRMCITIEKATKIWNLAMKYYEADSII